MKFVVYSQWKQLPENANRLFAQGEQDSLFLSRTWLESLTEHALAENQSIMLACVVDDETFQAILPMMSSLRDGLSALSANFTSFYSPLVSNHGQQDVILSCLAEGLSQMDLPSIRLEPIDSYDDNIIRLRQCMESCGFQSYPYFRFYNWMHPLNGQSFDQYMAERPANLRNTINRKRRKFERDYAYDIRLFKHEDIDRALLDYQVIYKSSWKANELYSDFTPSLVRCLSELGWLRLAILYIQDKPVATQIWFVVHGKASIYRLAYDECWKSYSPGSILTQYLMRYVIDTDKVSEVDFLTGNERYKQDWMSVQRERSGLRFVKQAKQKNCFSRMIESLKNKG
jgi:hypothetical protein